jgi:hypothetical protein
MIFFTATVGKILPIQPKQHTIPGGFYSPSQRGITGKIVS